MRAVLQFGAVRFLIDGETFNLLCDEVGRCLEPVVPLDRRDLCLRCSFCSYEAVAAVERAQLDDVSAAHESGAAEEDTPRPKPMATPAERKTLMSPATPPPEACSNGGRGGGRGPCVGSPPRSPSSPVASMYIFSQETFEAAEGRVRCYEEAVVTRRALLATLRREEEAEEQRGPHPPRRCPLPVLVLDPYLATHASVASVHEDVGRTRRRRSTLSPRRSPVRAAHASSAGPVGGPCGEGTPLTARTLDRSGDEGVPPREGGAVTDALGSYTDYLHLLYAGVAPSERGGSRGSDGGGGCEDLCSSSSRGSGGGGLPGRRTQLTRRLAEALLLAPAAGEPLTGSPRHVGVGSPVSSTGSPPPSAAKRKGRGSRPPPPPPPPPPLPSLGGHSVGYTPMRPHAVRTVATANEAGGSPIPGGPGNRGGSGGVRPSAPHS